LKAQRLRALVRHEVKHGLVDKPAALSRFGHPVDGPDRGFRQDNVDTSVHEVEAPIHIVYTLIVNVKIQISF